MKQVNNDVIAACRKIVEDEENEDTQLRNQHGTRFNRPPSSTINQPYKQSLFEYNEKMGMAVGTDTQIKQKFEANTQGFQLLSKTR